MRKWIMGAMLVLLIASGVGLVRQQLEINRLRHELDIYSCLNHGDRWDDIAGICHASE